jgi:hypothetical protein
MPILLKLSLVPLVVWLASVAGRRWGHAVTGWISAGDGRIAIDLVIL